MPIMPKKSMKKMDMEMPSGPADLGMALAIKRKNRKKMAFGGMAEADREPPVPMRKPDDMRIPESESMSDKWSEGSAPARKPDDMMLPEDETMSGSFDSDMDRPHTTAEAIMMKRKAKMMAEGGVVDIQDNGEEDPNDYDSLNEEAGMKELYDDSQLEAQPMDSNEHGDSIDADAHDHISEMRKKMKARGRI